MATAAAAAIATGTATVRRRRRTVRRRHRTVRRRRRTVRRRRRRRTAPQSLGYVQATADAGVRILATQRRPIHNRMVQSAIRVVRYRTAIPAVQPHHAHLAFAVAEDAAAPRERAQGAPSATMKVNAPRAARGTRSPIRGCARCRIVPQSLANAQAKVGANA